jgi:lipoprotein-releasing system permease protein
MAFRFFIAKRYLKSTGSTFLSIITVFSIGGIFVGVAAILAVVSSMNGFREDLKEKIVGTNAHVALLKYYNESLEDYKKLLPETMRFKHVESAAPFIYTKAMISKGSYVDGVVVRGVDQELEKVVTEVSKHIVDGSFDLGGDPPGIVLGVDLASNIRAHVGDTVMLASPFGASITPVGVFPKVMPMRVAGMFDVGMYEYNTSLVYMSLFSAQRFLSTGDVVTGIEIRLDDVYRAPEVAREIANTLGYPYRTTNWIDLNSNLFAALKLEKVFMFVILTLIVIVAAFNIISTLIMMVVKKTREIGILKSMGATSRTIMAIFMLDGIVIGVIGTALGAVGGFVISWLLGKYHLISLPADVYFLDTLPVHMEVSDFVTVCAAAVLISFLATIYPALRAAKLTPVDAIRYE